MRPTIRVDASRFMAALDALKPAQARAASVVAVNETARQTTSFATRLVAKDLGLKVGDVRAKMTVIRATKSNLLAIIRPSGRAIPLYAYKARQTKRGVSATAWGKRKLYRGTFIAMMPGGHVGVFKRVGATRLPIKELFEPSIGHAFGREPTRSQIEAFIRQKLPVNVARQLQRRLRVLSGKVSLSGQAAKRFEKAAA